MKTYGLLGKNISYSFSKQYFSEKFNKENIDAVYENFPLKGISLLPWFIENKPYLNGFNVTIPYKKSIIYFLDELDNDAETIGAVNVVKVIKNGGRTILKGFNSDVYGFEVSLCPLLRKDISGALVLGTGGAASAAAFVLKKAGIPYTFVSRTPFSGMIGYHEITEELVRKKQLIINASPLGTLETELEGQRLFPVQFLTKDHICYDLVYNPAKTRFLEEAEQKGAVIKNGYEMLLLQAEKAWEIWNI